MTVNKMCFKEEKEFRDWSITLKRELLAMYFSRVRFYEKEKQKISEKIEMLCCDAEKRQILRENKSHLDSKNIKDKLGIGKFLESYSKEDLENIRKDLKNIFAILEELKQCESY